MIVGVPKEIKNNEKRVALTPYGAEELVRLGHDVYIEKNAGLGSGFLDSSYTAVGAKILNSIDEVYSLSDLIVKVKEPQPSEVNLIKEIILLGYRSKLLMTRIHCANSLPTLV